MDRVPVDITLILLRWLHFLFGITWIGLLYYMNFVQTPFFGEIDPPIRAIGQQKLLSRAMWWFRWGAMGTVIFGLAYLLIKWAQIGFAPFLLTPYAVAILTGGTLGLFMWGNVWFVIWPKQKIVIASAASVVGGGQPNPAAAPSGRRAAIAKTVQSAGGKLEAVYFALGDVDVYIVVELPDTISAAAISLAVNQSGFIATKTIALMSVEEMDRAAKMAVEFRPPGR